jgi:hypothetical protein
LGSTAKGAIVVQELATGAIISESAGAIIGGVLLELELEQELVLLCGLKNKKKQLIE